MKNEYFLYRHIRLDKNQPFYIGIGKKTKHFAAYKTEYTRAFSKKDRNKIWKSIVKKTEYEVEILMESTSKEFIIEKEIEFIKLYGRIDLKTGTLSNMTAGGEGMVDLSPEMKEKLSRKGHKWSNESKIKLSLSNKGRRITWGNKITEANIGRKLSDETKEKVRKYQINNRKFGKDNRFSKKVKQIDRKTNEIIKIWDCAEDVRKSWNLKSNHISLCCKGKIYYAYGYKWEYVQI